MRHIWSIFAQSGSIWVAWVQKYLLKGKSFWCVSVPNNSSWCWRKLLNLRGLARGFLKFEVGIGSNIHLWVDAWHPFGALVDKFGYRVIYDSLSKLEAKLESVLKQGEWCWRPARSEELVAIQSRLSDVPIGVVDKPIWTIGRSDTYVCADTWNYLRKEKTIVSRWKLVWHQLAIPKQAFILWLAVNNKLSTGDRMLAWGFMGDTSCVFCRGGTESRDPLFFLCGFSSRIWKKCLKRCDVLYPTTNWDEVIDEGYRSWKDKSLKGSLFRLSFSAIVYNIWRARNEIKFGGQPRTEEQILKQIFWKIRCKISGIRKFQKNMENISLCHKWNVDTNMLI
jgi:hypothetical protein